MREMTVYNEDNFRDIEQYEDISVVRFSAPWCPPCRESEGFFDEFTRHLGDDVRTGRVNVDQAPVLTTKYAIWGLPTVLIFREGQMVRRIAGVKTPAFYAAALDDVKKEQ